MSDNGLYLYEFGKGLLVKVEGVEGAPGKFLGMIRGAKAPNGKEWCAPVWLNGTETLEEVERAISNAARELLEAAAAG